MRHGILRDRSCSIDEHLATLSFVLPNLPE